METDLTAHEQQEEKERFEALLIKTHDLTLQAENQKKAEKAVQTARQTAQNTRIAVKNDSKSGNTCNKSVD